MNTPTADNPLTRYGFTIGETVLLTNDSGYSYPVVVVGEDRGKIVVRLNVLEQYFAVEPSRLAHY